jgi:Rieske 2Fe-2S family protein
MPLPRAWYLEEAHFARELRMLQQRWLMAGHSSDLKLPGAYVCMQLAGRRIVVVRTAKLELAAFFDGCLHRRTALFDEGCGRKPDLTISCPYHGLRFALDGVVDSSMAAAFHLEVGARLPPLRVAERWGFVFVAPSDALDFDRAVGPVPPWLERAELSLLRRGRAQTYDVQANWKLCVQNFQESHHFRWVHPALERLSPAGASTSISLGGQFLGGTMELAERVETVSNNGQREGRPFLAAAGDRRTVFDALLFPCWMTSLQPDYLLSYRIEPRAAGQTRICAEIYFHSAAFHKAFSPSAVYEFWDRTNAEDRRIVELQQLGLAGAPFEPGPYVPSEDGVVAFDALLERALAEAL